MCVAMQPWAVLSLSCCGLCVLQHGPLAALSLLPSAWPTEVPVCVPTQHWPIWYLGCSCPAVCLPTLPGLAAGPLPLTGSVAPGEADSAC